jgi:hypothetical protein
LRVEQFYGESWLFAHYLLVGNPKRGAGLGPFLSLLYEGQPPGESFERAFGVSMQDMQGELKSWHRLATFWCTPTPDRMERSSSRSRLR